MSNLTNGTYRARAIEAHLGESSRGTPQIVLVFRVEGGAADGDHITAYLYFSDAAAKRSMESLRACGWQGTDIEDLSTVGSRDCEIVLAYEEYEGRERLKVQWINEIGRVATVAEMKPDARRAFAAKMRALAVTVPAKAGSTPPAERQAPPPRQPAQEPSIEDDLPF